MTEAALTFGTAGLRGPMRDGPDGMNVDTVTRATWAVAKVMKDRSLAGSTVVVGRDARHNSDDFALAAAEVLAAEGFTVVLFPDPVPTPVVAAAVWHRGAAAGVQITASHNPSQDNGYKVYLDGGLQIVPPTDRDIETAMAEAPVEIAREPVDASGLELVEGYRTRAASVRFTDEDVRVALTPMHGVGGELAVQTLARASTSPTRRNPEPPTCCCRRRPTSTPRSRSRWTPTLTAVPSASRHPTAGGYSAVTKPVGS